MPHFSPELRQKLKSPGIYAIVNHQTQQVYIGSTKNLYKRMSHYSTSLNGKKAPVSSSVRRAFKVYGRNSFSFRVLEYVSSEEAQVYGFLEALETAYIIAASTTALNRQLPGCRLDREVASDG